MDKRTNYYRELAADYAELYALKDQTMLGADYPVQSPVVDYSARDDEARVTFVGATNQLKPDIYQLVIGGNHNNGYNAGTARAARNFPANAVLDDKELQAGLNSINPKFGDFCTRVAGEAWGLPLIDQKTKAFMAIAIDVMAQNQVGPGSPFGAHVMMAMKQGATRAEIEEVLLFMCAYAGFNKAAGCFGVLNELLGPAK